MSELSSAASLSAPYQPLGGHFDEMLTSEGYVRPHWQPLEAALSALGRAELQRRVEWSRRVIRENGMTYHVQKEADVGAEPDRPWPLDIVPCVLSSEDWSAIEAAVIQRARLLNALLGDLYGPRKTVREGWLPPAFLFNHPGFLRPCDGIRPPDGVWLHNLAVDLIRGPDGAWRIIGERTETPMGLGYALENRLVLNETLGEAFRSTSVRRLASYFQDFKHSLATAARRLENPRIGVLTDGPSSPTYFEHSFLSRYLGYTLVQGTDLAVREKKVYLRTLGGLLPVDMILRRMESAACDPLELTSESANGAAGLLDVVRAGKIAVANALGSGAAESHALAAFMPVLSRNLLGEDLRLEGPRTWWCGQPESLEYAIEHLEELVVKPTYRTLADRPLFGRQLNIVRRERLIAKMRANPNSFAAQEYVPASTTPVRTSSGLAPRFLVIRAFASSFGDSYRVMPGGLARVSSSTRSTDVSIVNHGLSKDLWVVGDFPETAVTLVPQTRKPIDISRATFDLPSRVAENLYWLGRYAERVEATARIFRTTLDLMSGESTPRPESALAGAQALLKQLGRIPDEATGSKFQKGLIDALLHSTRKGGFSWQIHQLRNVAWLLRDRLSDDAWRAISRLESEYQEVRGDFGTLDEMLDRVVMRLTSFAGSAMEAMTRGHGWRLLDIGRRLERALQITNLLRCGLVKPPADERARLELLLGAADSSITYRSRYLTSMQADLVIDLLLVDDANPRAVAFQLQRLREHVGMLPQDPTVVRRSPEARLITDALAAVELSQLDQISVLVNGERPELDALLRRIEQDLERLSETLTQDYLTHVKAVRQMSNR
jgi:uncharacterized circularly permuted ATP-grasp superfamily protein/uncharacterized alpha-E superfamily protein